MRLLFAMNRALCAAGLALAATVACNMAVDTPIVPPTEPPTHTVTPTATPAVTPGTRATLTPTPSPNPSAGVLEDIPPCTNEDVSCEPRSVDQGALAPSFGVPAASGYTPPETSSVEEMLENGATGLRPASPVHIVLRGVAQAGTFRCESHGFARTNAYREDEIRFWMNLEDDEPLPSVDELIRFFTQYDYAPPSRVASNLAMVRGGLSTDSTLYVSCYADYRVTEYVLGTGPGVVTVAYHRVSGADSYAVYSQLDSLLDDSETTKITRNQYDVWLAGLVQYATTTGSTIVEGREAVVFLAPVAAQHWSISTEAWKVVGQWDMQMSDDGTVNAVRYGTSEGDPEHAQTLANLRSRITTAAAADAFAGERIANISGLNQYYRDIGAYEDITPDDGSSSTFTPAQPPPVPECATGSAVTNPGTNRGLVHDCSALLDAKDEFRGAGALNWAKDVAIGSWDGVTTSGTPSRVTRVVLPSKSLNGTIPAELGTLFEVTHLDLSSNSLTGSIPAELGWLYNLEELRLSGNSLTGCIPVALESVATNDLSSLNLLYCAPLAPGNLSEGTATQTSIPLSWDTESNASKYRVEYFLRWASGWTVDTEALTTALHTVDDLECGTAYQFRVSAYGSGTVYAAAWGEPSAVLVAETAVCTVPSFDEESYAATVPENAPMGGFVVTVSATDPNWDTLSYSIAGGNADGTFAVDGSTGAITVARTLDRTAMPVHTLTVEADDGNGNTASVSVEITVT